MKIPLQRNQRLPVAAFTLIELLVVSAVIAICAAALLPALAKAKKRAWRIQWLRNMHQFAMATTAYASDNREKLPVPDRDGAGWAWDLPIAAKSS